MKLKAVNKENIKKDGNKNMNDTIKRIMDNQEKAQENLINIVGSMFEMAGINTPSFDNGRFNAMTLHVCTEECINEFLEMQRREKKNFDTVMQRNFNGLDWVITAYEDTVDNFNTISTEEEKQSLFLQCLLALAFVNHTDRLGFINMLIKQTVETKCEIESGRSWLLANMLMIPEIAA